MVYNKTLTSQGTFGTTVYLKIFKLIIRMFAIIKS